ILQGLTTSLALPNTPEIYRPWNDTEKRYERQEDKISWEAIQYVGVLMVIGQNNIVEVRTQEIKKIIFNTNEWIIFFIYFYIKIHIILKKTATATEKLHIILR
ncbi:hypothetical protein ACJX0J_008497, partial [Zea mays]